MHPSLGKRLIPLLFSMALTASCLFVSAGRWSWLNGWVLLGVNIIASLVNMAVMWRNPDLLTERSRVQAGRSWDKLLIGIGVLLGPMAIWITAGLEARFRPAAAIAVGALAVGLVAALLGAFLVSWAMGSNRFFSSVVRIQAERGHVVVDAGPYGIVRHPGYAGMTLVSLATPLILNSRWALLPALLTAAANITRTALEDRTLHSELEGYADYARRVRARLIPLIW